LPHSTGSRSGPRNSGMSELVCILCLPAPLMFLERVEHHDMSDVTESHDQTPSMVPVDFHGYCGHCFYDLRGLPEARCPECGRTFDPRYARTFTLVSRSDRLRKTAQRTLNSLLQTLHSRHPHDAAAARRVSEARQLVELRSENVALRQLIESLLQILVAKGVLCPEDVEAIDCDVERALSVPQIIDDTEEIVSEEPTPDLLEIKRAADGHAISDGRP
jgi:hypothetical protein